MADWVDADVAARWATCPVDAVPRPIVLLEERVRIDGGFIDDESKVAWETGAIESDASVPPAVWGLLPARSRVRPRTS